MRRLLFGIVMRRNVAVQHGRTASPNNVAGAGHRKGRRVDGPACRRQATQKNGALTTSHKGGQKGLSRSCDRESRYCSGGRRGPTRKELNMTDRNLRTDTPFSKASR